MSRPAVVVAMAALVASLAALAWVAKTRADVVRPVGAPALGGALERAAQAAQGQRILVVTNRPGVAATGAVYESSRGPTGWAAYPPTPTADDPLLPALGKLADAAASEIAASGKLAQPTVRALAVFGVAVVVVGGDGEPVAPALDDRDPLLGAAPEVPALRVRKAQPVMLFLAEQTAVEPSDALAFARSLRGGDADFLDFEDHAPWGEDVTINAATDSEFLLPTTAAGARVTLDDAPATFRAARVPMLVVNVPAGRHRVSVRYSDEGLGRQWLAVAAAGVAAGSLIALWMLLRPTPVAQEST